MILHVSEMEIMKSCKIAGFGRAREAKQAKASQAKRNQQTTARQNKHTKMRKSFT